MTLTAVVTAHDDDPSRILQNLVEQTRQPDEVILLYSGDCGDVSQLPGQFTGLRVIRTENKSDWGHDKRAIGLDEATMDAVGFFNADDSYDPRYVELMMARIEAGADAVYCSWSTIPGCSFELGSSTSGNFLVRTAVGRRAGYLDRHYEADGTFINRIREQAARIARVDELVYFHNQRF